MPKGRTAWLVTWDDRCCQSVVLPERRVACILPARYQKQRVCQILPFLWQTHANYSLAGQLSDGTSSLRRDLLLHVEGNCGNPMIFYGTKPCLYARKVTALRVEKNESGETLHWREPDGFKAIETLVGGCTHFASEKYHDGRPNSFFIPRERH